MVEEKRRGLGPHPGPDELVAYHADELEEEEAKRLQDHLVLCPECARLLLELDAFTADAAVAPRSKVVPIAPYRAARRRRWIAAAAAVAAVVLLFVWPRGTPLPEYGPPRLSGESTRIRAVEAVTAEEAPLFAIGHRLSLRMQPDTEADDPITARAYVRRGAELHALSASTLEVRHDGVVSLDGILDTDLRLPVGESHLVSVVARPGALPSRRRLARDLATSDMSRGSRWIAFQRKIRVEESADRPPSSAWTADDDGPRIEYAGCRTIVVGPICHLRHDRRLTLWVRHHREEEIRIEAGHWRKPYPATQVQGGFRYEIEVGRWTTELVVEVRQEETRSIWVLELEHAPPPEWLVAAKERYDSEDWEGARRLLEPRLSGPDAVDAGAALSLLARIERRIGGAELGDKYYRQAIGLHRRTGRLFDQIRDAAGFTFYLIQEKRFSEARELLDSLPVDATAGSAESRNSVAYVRGLLGEETGDYRAALAWMTRAAREAERAGLIRKQTFAEDILARQLHTVGLVDAAAALYSRRQPRIADLCRDGGGASVFEACDCARFQMNRAWTGLLSLEAGRPVDGPDPAALLDEAERIFLEEEARGEGTCVSPEDLPNLRLNRALAALHAREPEEARRHLERAKVDPEAFPRLALWQLDVEARISLAEGKAERALDLYDDLRRRAELSSSPEAAWRAAFGRAAALAGLGRTGDALEACAGAESLLDRESLLVPMHAGRERFIGQRENATRFYLDLLLRAGREGEALDVTRRAAARALRRLRVSARIADLGADRDRWERAVDSYRDTRNEIEELAARIWKGLPGDEEERLMEEIEQQHRELRGLLDRLATAAEDPTPDSRELAPPARKTVLLAYHPLPLGWAAFAADEEGVTALRVEAAAENPPEEEFSSLLLEPFAEKIRGAEEVQVIPYGSLRAVDFHALPFAGGLLLDHAPVVYRLDLPALPMEAPPTSREALVVAGPGLLEALAEGREVRNALESRSGAWQVEYLAGDEASAPGVRRRLGDVALLHLASHADFDEDSRGWDSHVKLAGGGRLSVDDILASPRVPRWVVLSGCETGRDDRTAPLPSIGLAQAFLVAGAESVVAVTEKVSDADAAALSAALYRHWDASTTLAAALRKAQLERRDQAPESDWRKFRVLKR